MAIPNFKEKMDDIDSCLRVGMMYSDRDQKVSPREILNDGRKKMGILKKQVDSIDIKTSSKNRELKKKYLSDLFFMDECYDQLAIDSDGECLTRSMFKSLPDEYPDLFGKKAERKAKKVQRKKVVKTKASVNSTKAKSKPVVKKNIKTVKATKSKVPKKRFNKTKKK